MLSIERRLLPGFGTTYGPGGDGPFPSVLVLHGSEGGFSGWSHCICMLLAAHGYLAYPYSYSQGGNAWNAGSIKDVPVDTTADALAALRKFDFSTDKTGLYGVSRGGEHALLLASLMATERSPEQPDAVAAHSPADVICGAFDAKRFRDPGDPGWREWDPADRAWSWRGTSEELKPTTPIDINKYQGPLFLSHGSSDRVWSVDMTKRLESKLQNRKPHLEVHYYEGEDHMFSNEAYNKHHALLIQFFNRFLLTP